MKQFFSFVSHRRWTTTPQFWMISTSILLSAGMAAAAQPRFTSFDYPGAVATSPEGINAAGDVVGFYVDSKNVQHGFLLRAGTFTSVDYPGAIATHVNSINVNGDMVGFHVDTAGLPGGGDRGFVLEKGGFVEIMYPGHLNTILQRITDEGVIFGCYHDTDTMGTMHGIQFNFPTEFSALDMQASMSNGALIQGGVAAGFYTDMMTNVTHGYLASKDTFAPFDFPFSIATNVWDLSPAGELAGVYTDTAKKAHGFVLKLDDSLLTFGINPQFGVSGSFSFESVDFPGATATRAFGINAHGTVVGSYTDAGAKTHGYLLTRPQDADE